MTEAFKALTHVGDALVILGSMLLALLVFVVTMVFDVSRFVVRRRAH